MTRHGGYDESSCAQYRTETHAMRINLWSRSGVRLRSRCQPRAVIAGWATVYGRAGSLNVIRAAGAGASRRSGRTRRGCSKVLNACRSDPVSVSQVSTRVGVAPRHSSWSSRSPSRSRLSISTHAWPFCGSCVATTSTYGTCSSRAKSACSPAAAIGYVCDSTRRSSTRPRAYCNAHAYG